MKASRSTKPVQKPTIARQRDAQLKVGRRNAGGLFRTDTDNAIPQFLLTHVTFDCTIGEERRCVAQFKLREKALKVIEVFPIFVRVVGGGPDLLLDKGARGQPIPGVYGSVVEANNAAVAWASAINEDYA